jgi:hypothetical protein
MRPLPPATIAARPRSRRLRREGTGLRFFRGRLSATRFQQRLASASSPPPASSSEAISTADSLACLCRLSRLGHRLCFPPRPSPALLPAATPARLALARNLRRRQDSIETARPAATGDRSVLGIRFAAQALAEFLEPIFERPLDRLPDRPR